MVRAQARAPPSSVYASARGSKANNFDIPTPKKQAMIWLRIALRGCAKGELIVPNSITAAAPYHQSVLESAMGCSTLYSRIRPSQLTKLPIIVVASCALKEGTRFETDATKATPQNVPIADHKATTILPIGLGGLSRYPSIYATGLGMRCHRGAGTNGFRYRSISKFQVVGRDSVTGSCGDGAMLDFCDGHKLPHNML